MEGITKCSLRGRVMGCFGSANSISTVANRATGRFELFNAVKSDAEAL